MARMMSDALFAELLASVGEMGAIRSGERAPARAWNVPPGPSQEGAPDGTRPPRRPGAAVDDAAGATGDTRGAGHDAQPG